MCVHVPARALQNQRFPRILLMGKGMAEKGRYELFLQKPDFALDPALCFISNHLDYWFTVGKRRIRISRPAYEDVVSSGFDVARPPSILRLGCLENGALLFRNYEKLRTERIYVLCDRFFRPGHLTGFDGRRFGDL